MIISRSVNLRMGNASGESCGDNQNTRFMFSNFSFIETENRTVYEIMWKNTVQSDGQHMTIWRLRTACWISKATKTYSEYVILIDFPPQQWFRERASLLSYTYIVCLVSV